MNNKIVPPLLDFDRILCCRKSIEHQEELREIVRLSEHAFIKAQYQSRNSSEDISSTSNSNNVIGTLESVLYNEVFPRFKVYIGNYTDNKTCAPGNFFL